MTERIICVKCMREGHHSSNCTSPGYGSKFSASWEDGLQNALLAVLAHPGGLRHPGGLTGVEVAVLIGLGPDSAKSKLRELRRRGELGVGYMNGNTWLWMLPEDAIAFSNAQYEAMRLQDIESRQRRRDSKRLHAAKARGPHINDSDDDKESWPIVRAIVPAVTAKPPYTNAVRSVFELANA